MRNDFQRFMREQRKESESELKEFFLEQRKESEDNFQKFVTEQRSEFERYTGALKEHFEGGIEAITEGVNMNIEKTERLEASSKKEFDSLDKRLSQVEMTKARKRILNLKKKKS